jgi:molybdopterin-containing oxidoreductase family iron-sulfur binding subunit
MACKAENNLPNDVWWNKAVTVGGQGEGTPAGTYPDSLRLWYYTLACQHCDAPVCVAVCSTGATTKREDGIVVIDYEACLGDQACIGACPFKGVRVFIDSPPEYYLDFPIGDQGIQPHRESVTEKCTFCVHRIDRGERPACTDLCRSDARFFGDLDDPETLISKLLATREHEPILPDSGTGPNVYLLK